MSARTPAATDCGCGHMRYFHQAGGNCTICRCPSFLQTSPTFQALVAPREPDCRCGHAKRIHRDGKICTLGLLVSRNRLCVCERYRPVEAPAGGVAADGTHIIRGYD